MTLNAKLLLAGCALVASSLSAAPALAQTRGVTAGEQPGFYVGAGIGKGKAKGACDLSGTGFVGTCDDKDNNWNLFAGYQFTPNIAVELGYVDLGEVNASGRVGATAVNVSGEANGIELLGVGTFPIASNLSIYAKAGLLRWDSDAIGRVGATLVATGDKGTDFTVGIGAQYSFTPNIAGRVELQHYNDVAGADVNVARIAVRFRF